MLLHYWSRTFANIGENEIKYLLDIEKYEIWARINAKTISKTHFKRAKIYCQRAEKSDNLGRHKNEIKRIWTQILVLGNKLIDKYYKKHQFWINLNIITAKIINFERTGPSKCQDNNETDKLKHRLVIVNHRIEN